MERHFKTRKMEMMYTLRSKTKVQILLKRLRVCVRVFRLSALLLVSCVDSLIVAVIPKPPVGVETYGDDDDDDELVKVMDV